MRTSSRLLAAASLLMLLPPLAVAGECDPVPVSGFVHETGAVDHDQIGTSTRAWLNVQCSGQAAGRDHPLSEAAAKRSYERYLNSFDHPVPEFYGREQFVPGGGSK